MTRTRGTTRIPLFSPAQENAVLAGQLNAAWRRVLASGSYVLGAEVEAFEFEAAAYCGTEHAVGVASGTDALHLALRAAGVGTGDEVVTTAFTFAGTVEAILHAGALPVFADIDPLTFNLDPAAARNALSERTRAIIAVDLFGLPADWDAFSTIAREQDLTLIEDAAQAFGAEYDVRKAGACADFGCFSFYPTKPLGALGDGGLVVTNNAAAAARLRSLRNHGALRRFAHETCGFNSRLDGVQAACLRVKLPHVDADRGRRRALAARYGECLAHLPLKLPGDHGLARHAYHLYTVQCPDETTRKRICSSLAAHGIASEVYYPTTLAEQPAFATVRCADDLVNARNAARRVLALPLTAQLEEAEIDTISTVIAEVL